MAKASFESMITELEGLIVAMERGDQPVEQLLKQYQSGLKLIAACRDRLRGAEEQLSAGAEQGSGRAQ